jgi:hypothetical protein
MEVVTLNECDSEFCEIPGGKHPHFSNSNEAFILNQINLSRYSTQDAFLVTVSTFD